MKYKVGDKVFTPLESEEIAEITGIAHDEYGEYYEVSMNGSNLPYRYFEEDLKPFTVPDTTTQKETKKKVLIVEDGSVDIDKLEEDGFYVIVYRQGAKPPIFLEV